jgi:cytochrome c-type biogenesis protein CcmH
VRASLAVIIALAWLSTAHAASIDQPLTNAAQEKTAHSVFRELRCVVCAGQSLAESDATLAVQMRAHVRELVAQGKTEDEILAHFRARYGDQILLTPPIEQKTALLWLAPVLLLGGGFYAVWRMTRQNNGDHA